MNEADVTSSEPERRHQVTGGRAPTLTELPDEGVLIQTLYTGLLPQRGLSQTTQHSCWSTTDYEICGKVLSLGRGVGADCPIKEGDTVVVYPWHGCGQCETCSSGNSHFCEEKEEEEESKLDNEAERGKIRRRGSVELGSGHRILSEWKNAVRLPKEISGQVGCTLPYGALKVYAAILEARPVLEHAIRIRGFGNLLIIGGARDAAELWAVLLMKNIFCDKNVKVICADEHQGRLDLATRAGADDCVLWSADVSVDDLVAATTLGAYNKMDAAVDLLGTARSFSVALHCLHHGGALLALGDRCAPDTQVPLPLPLVTARSLTVRALKGGSRALLHQLVDHVSVLGGEAASLALPVECYREGELELALGRLARDEIKGRAVVKYE